MKITQGTNKNSKLKQVNCLERGKRRMTKLRVASDWLKERRKCNRPITKRIKAKPTESQIALDSALKIALNVIIFSFFFCFFLVQTTTGVVVLLQVRISTGHQCPQSHLYSFSPQPTCKYQPFDSLRMTSI